jgi:ABC-type antimicrobial peptide transport system permease subunit
LVLLLGAAVFYRSLDAARSEEVGFDVEHLLVVQLYRLQERRAVGVPDDVVSAMTDRVSRLPNVAGIAQSTVSAAWWSSVLTQRIAPQQLLASQSESPSVAGVTPNFFAMNGLSIERGRGFSDADDAAAPKVAVVSRSLARTLWPAVEPIDQCLSAGPVDPTQCVRVVGLVEDVGARVSGPDQFPRAYVPLLQSARNSGPRSLVIRTLDDPGRVIAPVLGIMAQLLPDLPRERVQALPDLLASRLRPWKVGGGLFMAAGGLALLVAAIGLYATTAFGVRLREHEFGIRRAVGATPRHLLLLAMRQTVAYAAGGIALGTVLGQWGARFVDPLLFRGVSARDPTVYLLAAIVLLATCLTATTFPARAAARVDPRLSLQAE